MASVSASDRWGNRLFWRSNGILNTKPHIRDSAKVVVLQNPPPSFCIFSMKTTKLAVTFAWPGLGDFSSKPRKSRHDLYVGPSLIHTKGLFLNLHRNFWRLHSLPLGLGLCLVEVRKNHKNNKILFQNCSVTFDYAQGPKWCYRSSHRISYLYQGGDDLVSGIVSGFLEEMVP